MQSLVVITVQWMVEVGFLMDPTSVVEWLLVTVIEFVLGYCFVVYQWWDWV